VYGAFCCVKMYHAEAGKGGQGVSFKSLHPEEKRGCRRRLCGAKCLTLSAIQRTSCKAGSP